MRYSQTVLGWTGAAAGAILAASALALSCGGGSDSPTAPNPGPMVVTVEISDHAFTPRSVTIRPGDTVRWVMRGAEAGHTVTDNGGAFDSGAVFAAAGDQFTRTFSNAEAGRTFEYRCNAHYQCCTMQGSVRVGEGAPEPSPGY